MSVCLLRDLAFGKVGEHQGLALQVHSGSTEVLVQLAVILMSKLCVIREAEHH